MSAKSLVVSIWLNSDPAEGESRWYDPVTGWETSNRRAAIKWVRVNKMGLTHYWNLI